MPNTTIDEVLLSVRDAGLADPDLTGVDALCRARLQAEIEREHRAGRRRSRFGTTVRITTAARFAAAVGVAVTIAGATYAVPATRAAVDDIYSAFSDWVAGDAGSAPGRAVAVGEGAPPWVAAEDGEKRLLAAAGGEKLVAIRQLVGPGRFIPNGRHDLRPLFGLVSASIKRIRFNYADGGPAVSEDALAGAFGMTIETNRRASSLTGYDQAGRLVARLDLIADPRDLGPGQTLGDFRYCPDAARGCPPWRK
jgi:hypothetical protein